MSRSCLLTVWTLVLLLVVPAAEAAEPAVDFNRDVRPILSNNCFQCHGPDASERHGGGAEGLRLDTSAAAQADLGGYAALVPGKPAASELIRRIEADDAGELMPPSETGKSLTPREIELLKAWIRQGAPYAEHWAYVPPQRPALPEVNHRDWPRNAIDHFLLARLEREGLLPSPEADRYTLARRVALDLTGLPPTWEEVEALVNDSSPEAYAAYVDRLLKKPAYGEHWARLWLDLARYADSAGYADDVPRTIWAYRDYVIRSFNANKPFDQFTIEQLAGDLLPNPTDEQLIATAFHRNTLTNNEGGTNDEEFRNAAVVDRVETTATVWMGTTLACAQCHTHKYDPLTQEEYFRFFAIFNSTADADRRDESPLLEIFSPEQKSQQAAWTAEIAELEQRLAGTENADTAAQTQMQREQLAKLKEQLAALKPETTVPILRELPEPRKTHLQYRGNFLDLGPAVTPGVPGIFPPLPENMPANRLALARWLVAQHNPLTARVVVNHFWEAIFGIGLVPTGNDFGSQGELPTHPELLDWLATEFIASGWDVQHLLRLMVTSAAYRQSSRVTTEAYERDPENQLLARGPRFRLPAETIRDQALFVSGLLSAKMYGPPVQPPQPTLGLSAAFGSGIDWQTSAGEDRYRRGLYTRWRRSSPYPSMAAFDAPTREVCTQRRERTNTPLQALVTLNDPVYVEAAQALARRMVAAGSNPEEKVRFGFQTCLTRVPSDVELAALVQLYEKSHAQLSGNLAEATALATDPLGPLPEGSDAVELAAWTVVGNVLLNLDELLMRR